jgi:hypothetical protein
MIFKKHSTPLLYAFLQNASAESHKKRGEKIKRGQPRNAKTLKNPYGFDVKKIYEILYASLSRCAVTCVV